MKVLASIKNENKLVSFILYDGTKSYIANLDKVKELAARNKIDTLYIENRELKPTFKGNESEALSKVDKNIAKKIKNDICDLTLNQYININAQFRAKDIEVANSGFTNAAGTVSSILKYQEHILLVEVLVYGPSNYVDKNIQKFAKDNISNGNIVKESLLLKQGFIYQFSFLVDKHYEYNTMKRLNENYNINIFWNKNSLNNIMEKLKWNTQRLNWLQGKVINLQLPSDDDVLFINKIISKYSI